MRFLAVVAAVYLLGPSNTAHAQDETDSTSVARNLLYVEFGGSALIGSLSYERLLNQRWRARAGLTGFAFALLGRFEYYGATAGAVRTWPVRTWAASAGGAWEVGGSLTLTSVHTSGLFATEEHAGVQVIVAPQVGYSYRPVGGGLYVRFSLTPLGWWDGDRTRVLPWGGVSVGGAF